MPYQPTLCCLDYLAFLGKNNGVVSEQKQAVMNVAVTRLCAACVEELQGHIVQGATLLLCNADFNIQGKPGSLEIYQLPWSLFNDCSDFSQRCCHQEPPRSPCLLSNMSNISRSLSLSQV